MHHSTPSRDLKLSASARSNRNPKINLDCSGTVAKSNTFAFNSILSLTIYDTFPQLLLSKAGTVKILNKRSYDQWLISLVMPKNAVMPVF